MHGGPVRASEHQVGVVMAATNRQLLLGLASAVGTQRRHRHRVQGKRAAALGRLRLRDLHLVVHQDSGSPHRHPAGVQVQVAPAQPQDLPATHPSRRGQQPRRIQPIAPDVIQEHPKLRRAPRPHLRRLGLRRVSSIGHVPYDVAPSHRIPQCPVQDRMDVVHGLRCQPTSRVAATPCEQLAVEGIQLGRAESLQLDRTQPWNKVLLDVHAVARPRRVPQPRHPHRRQLLLHQKARHRPP
jgi:hypothetical protein